MRSSNPPGPSHDSQSGTASDAHNNDTILPPSFRDVTSELAASLERECSAIANHFGAELPEHVDVAARVALLAADEVSLHELPASPDAYLVVGRHSEASVRTAGAQSLSLRHVLLIPQRTAQGPGVVLDIVALAPTMRIAPWPRPLPGGLAERSTALVLGDSLLLVAPVTRSEQHTEIFIAPEPASKLGVKPRPEAPPAQAHRRTRITSAAPAESLPAGDDLPDDARLVLEVRNDGERVRIGLREPWLVGGIVLGRNTEKCSHASLARVLASPEVSRCHLYLRREQDDIVFYDTASTSGVHLSEDEEAEAVRRFVVPAPRAKLEGGSTFVVNPERTWLWLTPDVRVTLYAAGNHDEDA